MIISHRLSNSLDTSDPKVFFIKKAKYIFVRFHIPCYLGWEEMQLELFKIEKRCYMICYYWWLFTSNIKEVNHIRKASCKNRGRKNHHFLQCSYYYPALHQSVLSIPFLIKHQYCMQFCQCLQTLCTGLANVQIDY